MKNRLTPLSQKLRREMTKEERKLWYCFLRTYPVRFHRQYVIDHYIVDFYCHKARLIVELDGSQHFEPEKQMYDQTRTAVFLEKGMTVQRFSNLDVLQRFDSVCQTIDQQVRQIISEMECFT